LKGGPISLKNHNGGFQTPPTFGSVKGAHIDFEDFPIDFNLQIPPFQVNFDSSFQAQNPSSSESKMSSIESLAHRRSASEEHSTSTDYSSAAEPPQRVHVTKNYEFFPIQQTLNSTLSSSQLHGESSPDVVKGKKVKKNEESKANKGKNELRNAPGLIFARVKKGIKQLLEENEEERDDDDVERLHYIKKIIESEKRVYLNFAEDRFLVFLGKFTSNIKTWKGLKDVCLEERLYARVFLLCIEKFLGQDEEKDFQEYIDQDRGNIVKKNIKERKSSLLKKFKSTFGFLYRKTIP